MASSRLTHPAPRLLAVIALLTAGLFVVAAQSPPAARASGVDTPAVAQPFIDLGPAPLVTDQNTPLTNQWSGALDAIVVDPVKEPNRPRQVWVGSVNGGVWRTRSLDVDQPDQAPNWTTQTDHLPSLSIGALALDPTTIDPSNRDVRTLVAGFGGATSASRNPHGPLVGVALSTDAGQTWTPADSAGIGGKVTGLLIRGHVIVASTSTGVYRSHDSGASFTQVIAGNAMALTEDPGDLGRAFVAVLGAGGGIYRVNDVSAGSADDPASWQLVEPLTALGADAETTTTKISLSAQSYPLDQGGTRTVVTGAWLADDNPSGTDDGDGEEEGDGVDLGGELRSEQAGALGSWVLLDPIDDVVDEHQGKLVVANDDTEISTFYISGDQGDTYRCSVDGTFVGCGGLGGPAAGVHFDRRGIVFDDGSLLVISDGGIYQRTSPRDPGDEPGTWYQRQGDLEITESYGCAYDDLSHVAGCANQDNGVSFQPTPGAKAWDDIGGYGDGTVVAVSDAPVPCSTSNTCSTRYFSGQSLRNFTRARCDADNNCDVTKHDDDGSPALIGPDGDIGCTGFPVDPVCGDENLKFLTPVAANPYDGNRVIMASGDDGVGTVYESTDGAESLTALTGFTGVPSGAILYGGATPGTSSPIPCTNEAQCPGLGAIYLGSDEGLFVRAHLGDPVTRAANFDQDVVGKPTGVAVDPTDVNSAWVVTDLGKVLHSTDGTDPSAAWVPLTGDLKPGGDFARHLHAVAIIPAGPTTAVVVGGDDGVYLSDSNRPKTWYKLSGKLPNAVVSSLQYDAGDDVLLIGTYGRSAWMMPGASQLTLPPVLDASASDNQADFNDEAHFSATLTDGRGGPITGVPVHFELGNGTDTQTCSDDPLTDAAGVATCTVTLTMSPGSYTLTATFDPPEDLVGASDTQAFTITKEESALQYTGPRSGDTHDPVTVTATLFDPDGGAPIADRRVTFTLGNPVLGQACTSEPSDALGHASCEITPFQPAGDYLIVASFAGGANYLSAESPPVGFTILHEESTLTLDPVPHVLNGAPATLGARLVEDTDGPPIIGVPVTFTIGSGATAQTCIHDTDINGHASCTFANVSQPGSATSVPVAASFAGNDFYLPAADSGTALVAYYRGRATGLMVSQSLLLPMALVAGDTGLVTTSAASHTERFQASINAPLVSIKTLDSTVDTGGGTVTSASTATGVTISAVGLPLITITTVGSTASSTCNPSFVASATGHTTLGSLRIGGLPITLTSGPNQVVNLGLAKLVINEQRPLPGTSAGIVVNGLHLTGLGLDLVVSHAEAGVLNCP